MFPDFGMLFAENARTDPLCLSGKLGPQLSWRSGNAASVGGVPPFQGLRPKGTSAAHRFVPSYRSEGRLEERLNDLD